MGLAHGHLSDWAEPEMDDRELRRSFSEVQRGLEDIRQMLRMMSEERYQLKSEIMKLQGEIQDLKDKNIELYLLKEIQK